jgi:thiol-disulfide isomerase/thioredoxin
VLAVVQAACVGLYLLVEDRRADEPAFAWVRVDEPSPGTGWQRAGVDVPDPEGPHLVHLWATWCAPCLEELPVLLQAARSQGVPLRAVSDEPWSVVQRHFGGDVPPEVVVDPAGDAATRWGVASLPDTFVVVDGRIVGHLDGPRDWRHPDAIDWLHTLTLRGTP